LIQILDAAALLNNESFEFEKRVKYFTTSKVFDEWKDFRSKQLAENAFAAGLLTIQDPCPLSIQKTDQKAAESGTEIGDADVSLIGLAIEFRERNEKFIVITDDYSVQNILKKLKIKFRGVIQKEIKKHIKFKK